MRSKRTSRQIVGYMNIEISPTVQWKFWADQISTTLRHHRKKIFYKISNLSNFLLLLKKIKCQYCKVKEPGDIQSTSQSHVVFLGVNKKSIQYIASFLHWRTRTSFLQNIIIQGKEAFYKQLSTWFYLVP